MPDNSHPTSSMNLLRTKLHPQTVPIDVIHRPEQMELLSEGQSRPLVLVSAPAGYGKSTLISEWLEQHAWPSCWLTLDGDESDLRRFLAYMVSAVQQIFPESLERTSGFIQADELPGIPVLLSTLANELDEINHPFILVLDDFHSVDAASPVNNFLISLLAHPPIPLHLVIVTRQDPAISLDRLRAKGQILEIGLQELRFDLAKTKQLVDHVTDTKISQAAFANLDHELEGWVTGLKLVMMGLRFAPNPDQFLKSFKGGTRRLQDFLSQEVLAGLPQSMRHFLLLVSKLDRFCAPLCQAVCDPQNTDSSSGNELVKVLQTNNLFTIPLDEDGTWFRFHHLFQEFLQSELEKIQNNEQIDVLHLRASEWCERNGFVEEAIKYALKAGEPEKAADIIVRHRQNQINKDNWHVIHRWLSMLPSSASERPELLLAKAWMFVLQFRFKDLATIVTQIKELAVTHPMTKEQLAELRFFEGDLKYWEGHGAEAEEIFASVREDLLGEAQQVALDGSHAYSMLIQGKLSEAHRQLNAKEIQSNSGMIRNYYGTTHCLLSISAGDLRRAQREAELIESDLETNGMKYAGAWNDYFMAYIGLQTGCFRDSTQRFRKIKDDRYIAHRRMAIDALAGLALSLQLSGNETAANQAVADLKEFALELSDLTGMEVAESCASRVLLLQGNVNLAAVWAGYSSEPAVFQDYFLWQEIPKITRARLWVAYGSKESLERAIEYLDQELVRVTDWHLDGQKVEILALRSLALAGLGHTRDALLCLIDTVQLAANGKWLRPFLEPGAAMLDLMEQLDQSDFANDGVRQILEQMRTHKAELEQTLAANAAANGSPYQSFVDDLTKREQEILGLVAQRFQNKEIAVRLSVSPETVKSHLKHLYSKLDVSNRREAAERFREIPANF